MALCTLAGLLAGIAAQLELDDTIIRSGLGALLAALPEGWW